MHMGDTVFLFLSTVMVMIMTPGLALFYGGMVRSKNVLSTTMHSYSAMAIVSIQWIFIGYSLAFGPDWNGLIGNFDWFGFNVGSTLTLNDVALTAFINTNTAAAASALTWMLTEWFFQKKPTVLGAACGAVSGLVAITPSCGFVTPLSALIIGAIGGALCFLAVYFLKHKLGYDDALDAFGCHGIGGTWGGIATGLFATTSVNSAGADGLFYGNAALLWKQLLAIGATYAFTATMTYAIIKGISLFLPVRAHEHEEKMGLDLSLHGERAYEQIESLGDMFDGKLDHQGGYNSPR
ncbi:ammonium transporter [Bacillus sp. WLY-B-L8]|uniref:ammonium transporter n=1 Tax=Bacillus multifaciens TaxID=3068506 RepID=UPI0027424D7A|nr:ammonium transporter [Bacillus sp. WLY-B-L8]MDP7977556.1 ammonium transporter [Bacillus sp. WLY-B-L8]